MSRNNKPDYTRVNKQVCMARYNRRNTLRAVSLGHRIQTLMEERGLSQAELARRVGLTQPAIFALINKNKTGSKSLHLIARELHTTPAYLNGETDDQKGDSPEVDWSSEERELLDLMRVLQPKDRAAILQLARSLANCGKVPPTLHDRQLAYGTEGA